MEAKKENVIIFRDHMLPISETFIRSQALAMQRYNPFFVGLRRVSGLDLPAGRSYTFNEGGMMGRLREASYKVLLAPPRHTVRHLKELAPRLVHAHFAFDAIHALPLARALDVPLLVTLHGYDVTLLDEQWRNSNNPFWKLFPRRRKGLIASHSHYIAVSDFIRSKAVAQGYPAERVTVHYIGVDTDLFQSESELPQRPLILFVGRLVEKKGCVYLIKAMKQVQAVCPQAELVVIGNGPLLDELVGQASKEISNARFLGAQPSERVREFMQQARLLCVPSVTAASGDAEGLPIVVYEAMAYGKPIVGSRSAGIAEAVEDGITGLLAEERDYEALARHILRLLNDDKLWKRLSEGSLAALDAKFSLSKQTAVLESHYDSILSQR